MITSVFETAAFQHALFFPGPDRSDPPDGAVDRRIQVDGATLRLRVHHAERPRCMVCFVGNGEHAGDYDDIAARLGRLAGGLAIAVVDHRGYGKSTGQPSYPALLDDARAVVRELTRDWPAPRLVVFGRSLGSQAALHALDGMAPAGVVIDSGFCDLDALVARRGLPSHLITADDRRRFDVLDRVRGYPGAILGLHGAGDTLIAVDDGRAIIDASTHPASRFVAFDGHGHNDLFAAAGYDDTLDRWLRDRYEPR